MAALVAPPATPTMDFVILDTQARIVKYVLNNGANISTNIDASFRISANNLRTGKMYD